MAETPRTVALKVVDGGRRAPKMGQTRAARWRTGVLILVHVFMIVHIVQWLIVGMTISPVEPSESMETLEVGVVNAGAIMFGVALLSTAVFGRFFCGWLCHMVAMQDLCAVVMARMGVRPKPFRSRLLVFFPLVLALYMFVWPTFKRLVLRPVLESNGVAWPVWLKPVNESIVLRSELVVSDYWATFPAWYIAIPFLLICGFATVYFLGAKAFCTYGCPYGGFFAPLDKVSPTRIIVNDSCEGCAHCTSACTSNVRVHEEVANFGMVIDQGCMKTLDCVSACPNDALRVGVGRPAIFAKARDSEGAKAAKVKAKRRYDLTMGEEIAAALVFLWLFYATRGFLDQVPMLLAGGLAAVGTMLCVSAWWLVRRKDVRIHSMKLKAKGRIKPLGYALVCSVLGLVAIGAWSTNAKVGRWRGDMAFASMEVPADTLLRPDFIPTPELQETARKAVEFYESVDSLDRGGMGWSLNAEQRIRLSYFYTMLGEREKAVDELGFVIRHANPTSDLVIRRGKIAMSLSSDADTLMENNTMALEAQPHLHLVRAEVAKGYASRGEIERAESMWEARPEEDEFGWLLAQASYAGFIGESNRAARLLGEAGALIDEEAHEAPVQHTQIAFAAYGIGQRELVEKHAALTVAHPDANVSHWLSAAEFAVWRQERELGLERVEHALTMDGADRPTAQRRAAALLADSGQTDRGFEMLKLALEDLESPFDKQGILVLMVRVGLNYQHTESFDFGLERYESLARAHPEYPVLSVDYATILIQLGRNEEGLEAMIRAAGLDERNAFIAWRVAEICAALGDAEANQRWVDEAQRRESLGAG